MNRIATIVLASVVVTVAAAFAAGARAGDGAAPPEANPAPPAKAAETPHPDLSGHKRVGEASFYAKMFSGRQMADGADMDPQRNNAASRTLPLGTTAKVTDLKTGKSAVVVIEDRGPYAKGRLVDLSPSTAKKIGITPKIGVAKVVVAPIAVPQPDGKVKPGAAAHEAISAKLAAQGFVNERGKPFHHKSIGVMLGSQ